VTELPKIARARLKAQASGPVDAHPDADLLTAFSERSLTETERQHVIAHLALCADCREAVALALSPQAAEAAPAPTRRERQRLGWAHWFALAASVVVVAAAVLQLQYRQPGTELEDMAPRQSAPASAESRTAAEPRTEKPEGTVATAAPASQPPAAIPAEGDAVARKSASKDDFGEARVQSRVPAQSGRAGNEFSIASGGIGAGAGPSSTSKPMVGALSDSMSRERRDAPPPPAPARANEGVGQEENRRATDALKAKDAELAAAEPAPGTRKFERQVPATVATDEKEGATFAVQAAPEQKFRDQPAAASAATAQTEANVQKKQPAKTATMSSAFGKLAGGLKAPLRWTVSAIGVVQRSLDGGKTWQDLPIREGVRFRTVAAQDGNIWAGGDGGALFYSADGGETWTSRPLSGDAKRLEMKPGFDIVRIDVNGGQVMVTTSQGQTFTSRDGGASWSQQ
jgi:hypothetical protein